MTEKGRATVAPWPREAATGRTWRRLNRALAACGRALAATGHARPLVAAPGRLHNLIRLYNLMKRGKAWPSLTRPHAARRGHTQPHVATRWPGRGHTLPHAAKVRPEAASRGQGAARGGLTRPGRGHTRPHAASCGPGTAIRGQVAAKGSLARPRRGNTRPRPDTSRPP